MWHITFDMWHVIRNMWHVTCHTHTDHSSIQMWRVSYGLWFMVYGLWFMVYGLWFMVYGLWFMVYGLWFRVSLLYHARLREQWDTATIKAQLCKICCTESRFTRRFTFNWCLILHLNIKTLHTLITRSIIGRTCCQHIENLRVFMVQKRLVDTFFHTFFARFVLHFACQYHALLDPCFNEKV